MQSEVYCLPADGTVVWGLERGTLRTNPKFDRKHHGKKLFCLEVQARLSILSCVRALGTARMCVRGGGSAAGLQPPLPLALAGSGTAQVSSASSRLRLPLVRRRLPLRVSLSRSVWGGVGGSHAGTSCQTGATTSWRTAAACCSSSRCRSVMSGSASFADTLVCPCSSRGRLRPEPARTCAHAHMRTCARRGGGGE